MYPSAVPGLSGRPLDVIERKSLLYRSGLGFWCVNHVQGCAHGCNYPCYAYLLASYLRGMAETGRQAGFDRLIGFDMGGTSTDVSHFAGEYERAFETEVAEDLLAHLLRRRIGGEATAVIQFALLGEGRHFSRIERHHELAMVHDHRAEGVHEHPRREKQAQIQVNAANDD